MVLSGKIKANLDINAWATLMRGAKAKGGTTRTIDIKTPKDWCDYYGLKVEKGIVILYKAVDSKYISPRGACYAPGTCPEAADWDGGEQECGKGLHFSPHPKMALCFNSSATNFVGCPIKLTEMAIHWDGDYPEKCKAMRVIKPTFEVDIDGEPMPIKRAA